MLVRSTFEREIAFSDVRLGRDLMGIYPVPERKLFISGGVFLSEKVGYSKVIVSCLQECLALVASSHPVLP